MTACIDLALALVENDHGVEMARSVAKKMVVYHRRTGGQSQFSALLELEPKSDRIQTALTYAKRNLRKPLSVDQLADAANLSRRQFSRAFRAETGQSPARGVEKLRVEAARELLEECVELGRAVPGIFPMPDGGLQLEWASPDFISSIEISPRMVYSLFELDVASRISVDEETTDLSVAKSFVQRTLR